MSWRTLPALWSRSLEHWARIDIAFDYIYSGFLGSHRQVDVILSAKERFGSCLIADPVFADNGKLYDTMSAEMVRDMRRLVAQADLITPNVTEAQFLLDDFAPVAGEQQAYAMLERLSAMGPARVVMTGCPVADTVYIFAYDRPAGAMHKISCDYLPVFFHGAGDLFASVVTGALARGAAFEPAVRQAAAFIRRAIDVTVQNGLDVRRGLAIELVLKELAEGE